MFIIFKYFEEQLNEFKKSQETSMKESATPINFGVFTVGGSED
jgi:hypothetical protein